MRLEKLKVECYKYDLLKSLPFSYNVKQKTSINNEPFFHLIIFLILIDYFIIVQISYNLTI